MFVNLTTKRKIMSNENESESVFVLVLLYRWMENREDPPSLQNRVPSMINSDND